MQGNKYQLQSSYIGFIPQVLLEVEVVHVFIDETKWNCIGRVRPHEPHYVHTPVVKEIVCMDLVAKPLDGRSVVGSTSTATTYRNNLGDIKQPVASVCF